MTLGDFLGFVPHCSLHGGLAAWETTSFVSGVGSRDVRSWEMWAPWPGAGEDKALTRTFDRRCDGSFTWHGLLQLSLVTVAGLLALLGEVSFYLFSSRPLEESLPCAPPALQVTGTFG